jgi:hypothetical protein
MYLLDQRNLGFAILALLGAMVLSKWVATGTILDRPDGSLLAWTADLYNWHLSSAHRQADRPGRG